ncbi:MAG: DUF4307 domain-containing protein [Allobranchiibius sp.]
MQIPRPAPGQGKWWAIGSIGVVLMSAMAIWFGIAASGGVQWSDAGHDIVSDTRVEVTFDVINQNGRPVSCVLEAQDNNHSQVGVTTVDLPASNRGVVRYIRTLSTVTRAVTGTVDSCSYR